MQLWQLDVTASAFLADGTEVKIVTGIDDHSRFCVIAKAVMRATARPVCLAFVEAMRVYGVPEEVLTDNGKVFTGRFHKPGVPAEVLFERICRENGITHRLTKIRSPTTTGKIERLHQTLQRELLDVHGPFASIEALQAALDAWRAGIQHRPPAPVAGHGLPRQPVHPGGPRRWSCASPPSSPPAYPGSRSRPSPVPVCCPHSGTPAAAPAPVTVQAHTGCMRWRWTGWFRRRETCGSAGSRSGSAPPCPGGRSPSGPMRSACMCCWTAPGSRPLPSRLGVAELARLAASGARPAGPSPLPAGDGAVIEVDRTVNATGLVSLADQQVSVGSQLAGQRVTLRMEGPLMAVLSHDGSLLRTLACPIPADRRYRLRGARRARSLPPQPGGPITVQRRVSSRGGLMVARQKIHAGMIHAGKTATVICENNYFRVVIEGETAAVVPRTTTSEVHRYKANATDKRTLTRLTPEGQ